MKTMRKIMAVILTFAMVLSLGITAFAEGTTYTITINNTVTGYEYEAYQVFDGDLDVKTVGDTTTSTLSNIVWGTGVNGPAILTALKGSTADVFKKDVANPDYDENDPNSKATISKNVFEGCTNAAGVAEVLADNASKADFAKAFADIAGANLVAEKAASSTEKKSDVTEGNKTVTKTDNYEISVSDVGYYLVKNSEVPDDADNTVATDFILEVVKSVIVDPKASVPSLTKTFADGGNAAAASIGDEIEYKVVGTMPSTLADYNTYYYKFVDTMSKGLTYNGDLAIYLENNGVKQNITEAFGGGFYKNADGETVLQYAITDILALNLYKDDSNKSLYSVTTTSQIIFEYSATVNKDAVVGLDGNPNTANLVYSNDPTQSGTPTTTPPTTEPPSEDPPEAPDEPPTPPTTPPTVPDAPTDPNGPSGKSPTGETPDSVTMTYLTKITVYKVDGDDVPLAGAEFSIAGTGVQYQYTEESQFVAPGDGETAEYWLLADGTYTKTAPTTDTLSKYATGTNVGDAAGYVMKQTVKFVAGDEYVFYNGAFKAEALLDANSKYSMSFSGLSAGDYTIKETKTPSGYNTAADTNVKITFNAPETVTADAKCSWTVEGADYDPTTGTVSLTVVNNKGSVLPSTGGIGTTIFYAVGAVLVIGAGVLFITRKRMSGAED